MASPSRSSQDTNTGTQSEADERLAEESDRGIVEEELTRYESAGILKDEDLEDFDITTFWEVRRFVDMELTSKLNGHGSYTVQSIGFCTAWPLMSSLSKLPPSHVKGCFHLANKLTQTDDPKYRIP